MATDYWSAPPSWAGQTGYLVCGGPSLIGVDLEPLRGRNVVAVNSSFLIAPFADYLVFGDVRWWNEADNQAAIRDRFEGEVVAVHGTAGAKGHRFRRLHRADPKKGLATRRDTAAMARTVTTAGLNLLVHLGVTRIVIFGLDQRRDDEGRCHHHPPHRWKNKPGNRSWDAHMKELSFTVEPLEQLGIEVINASPASRIDWWPKRDPCEVLAELGSGELAAMAGVADGVHAVAPHAEPLPAASAAPVPPASAGTLITEPYRALNAELHQSRPDYGRRGDRHASVVTKLMARWKTEDVLDYGCGKGRLAAALPNVRSYDPAVPAHAADPGPADLTVCTDVLEHVEPDCLDAVLGHLRDRTRFKCYAVISLKPDRSKALPDGSNPHRIVKPLAWWRERLGRYFWVDAARESANGAEAIFHMRPRWDAITVVTFLWQARPGMEAYGPQHVNTMARMVARHLKMPHRFVCITDRVDGIEAETLPLWPEIAQARPPKRLSCYRRLRLFAADAGDWLGRRILMLDLDGVISGPLDPLVDRPEPFVIWHDPLFGRSAKSTGRRASNGSSGTDATAPAGRGTRQRVPYNGGMWLLTAGARRQVWDDFDPATSPAKGSELGYIGSDQRWIGYRLGPDEATWGQADGVLSYRYDVKDRPLPAEARVVWFHGQPKPWHARMRAVPWIAEHWR